VGLSALGINDSLVDFASFFDLQIYFLRLLLILLSYIKVVLDERDGFPL
jgi:hypothetical protein